MIRISVLMACAIIVAGCSWSSQTREKIREQNIVTGTVAAMPVELRHDRLVERDESSEGTRDSGLETIVSAVGSAAAGGGSLLTGGAGGLALGLLGIGVAWWKKRQSDTALSQVVNGLEQAKQALPAESVHTLHNSLSKSMDTTAKARVKRAKASTT